MEGFVPVIEISDENFTSLWLTLKKSIDGASFVSLDCELSGLGSRPMLNFPQIDVRYENTAKAAELYSVVSLGISCYTCSSLSSLDANTFESLKQSIRSQNYYVQTFNILTCCTSPYMVECASLKFLILHGFDFNRQYSHGLLYSRPSLQDARVLQKNKHTRTPILKDVFIAILKAQKPVVLHNGYIDLVYLYRSFYTELPKKSETFAADLSEMFPSGIYDTKYIAEYHCELPATYLEYLFKTMQLNNARQCDKGDWHIRLTFPPYPETVPGLNWHPYEEIFKFVPKNVEDLPALCNSYKFHGWCSKGNDCELSHDVNRIVWELRSTRKRKQNKGIAESSVAHIINIKKCKMLSTDSDGDIRRDYPTSESRNNHSHTTNSSTYSDSDDNLGKIVNDKVSTISSGHRAGFDAFMTGYIFACCLSGHNHVLKPHNLCGAGNTQLEHWINKVYLIGKDFPFLVKKSSYCKTSSLHNSLNQSIRVTGL